MKHGIDDVLHEVQARYLETLEPARDPLLARLERVANERGLPISDPEVASLLTIVTRSLAARSGARPLTIVEVGTNIGYGAIVLARAAGEGSRVLTVELDAGLCEEARGYVREAGLGGRVEVLEGRALDVLASLPGPFDLAYVDCVKEEYPAYLEALVPKLNVGGVLLADNCLWRGLVAKHAAGQPVPPKELPLVEALFRFNAQVTSDPRLRGVLLPMADGVAYAVRLPG